MIISEDIRIRDFEQSASPLLHRAHQIMDRQHRSVFNDLELNYYEGVELAYIVESEENGGITQSSLCDHLGITAPAVLKITNKLESKGLITKQLNPEDRRSELLFPTEYGKKLNGQFRNSVIDYELVFYSSFSDDELEQFSRLLQKLISSNEK